MRYGFGGDMPGWAYTVSGSVISMAGGVTITFWDSETGGSQYTDLAGASDGSSPMTSVTSSDGTGARPLGSIPRFWGPDGVTVMWAGVGASARQLIAANDARVFLAGAQTVVGPKTFGPTGGVNDSRIAVYAEAAGQVAELLVCYSGSDTGQGGVRQRTMYCNEKGELRVISAKSDSIAMRVKGQTGQTANVFEQTDTGNVAVSWMAPNGSWRAPNLGHTLALSVAGNLTVSTGQHRIYNDTGVPLVIRAVRASVGTAPTGAAVRVDVNKNGTTIFTTQGNRPNIAVGTNTSKVTNMDVTALADGEYLTVDVDVIGSTVAGADLTVQILCS
jgi:hypothetical protein